MSHPEAWNVDPAERVREILGPEYSIGPEDTLVYEFLHGYERLEVRHDRTQSGFTYAGSHHPGDGMCHALAENVDGSNGICVHCGRTLM